MQANGWRCVAAVALALGLTVAPLGFGRPPDGPAPGAACAQGGAGEAKSNDAEFKCAKGDQACQDALARRKAEAKKAAQAAKEAAKKEAAKEAKAKKEAARKEKAAKEKARKEALRKEKARKAAEQKAAKKKTS